ncbi:hypothetical protein CMT30_05020 [Elizabethkingia anophelis]|nr:hypothetical protein [Elizabethkingia anophelis]
MQKRQDRLWIIQLEKFVYTKTHLAPQKRLLFRSSKKTNNQLKINKLNRIIRFSAIERKKMVNHRRKTCVIFTQVFHWVVSILLTFSYNLCHFYPRPAIRWVNFTQVERKPG